MKNKNISGDIQVTQEEMEQALNDNFNLDPLV